MDFIYVFGVFAIGAFIFQSILGFFQIKHFNTIYQELRKKGKVAIGRRSGKFTAGTIVFFAVDDDAKIIDARLMQGVTVIAKFKPKDEYIGQDIHFIDSYHPLVQKENKLTRLAMENAREIYLRVEIGNYTEEKPNSPLQNVQMSLSMLKEGITSKLKRSI
ncbi:transcriptional regulator GutM [Aerococcaceae bacterium WGS1372]